MATKSEEQTPLMQQYYSAKAKFPDAILLYRMGDFYETFGEEAMLTSKRLGLTRHRHVSAQIGTCGTTGSHL